MNVATIRAGIPALSAAIYLNTGTFGPLPAVVADEIRRAYTDVEQLGTFSPQVFWQMELEGFEAARHQVANLLQASADEIALTRNVTDGINTVLHGLSWQPGDEVILTDQEHPSGTVPWLALAERTGIRLRWLELIPDAGEILQRFQRLLTPRTRLAQLSHVSCLTGLRLPIERLCAVARQAGVLTLVDGAHAEGQFAVDVGALGCDFYAACGHKWLLGPQGVGMLYIRREHLLHLRPIWLGWDVQQPFDRPGRSYQLPGTAARFEQSTRPWPLYLAFGKAMDYVEGVGLDAIEQRVRQLRRGFLAGLSAIPGVTVHSPTDANLGTGLVTATLDGWPAEALQQRLWEQHRIITNIIRELDAVRFSLAFFTSEEELDAVLQALAVAAG
jgi:selenocysteine lyase/cysteine desulfurase